MNQLWNKKDALTIIEEMMLGNDLFSQLLGMELLDVSENELLLCMTVTEPMTNGFKIAHGGIAYALCDSAMAFLSNASGFHGLTIDSQISHIKSAHVGDRLTARCTCVHRGKTLGRYEIKVHNQNQLLIASFIGTILFGEKWLI